MPRQYHFLILEEKTSNLEEELKIQEICYFSSPTTCQGEIHFKFASDGQSPLVFKGKTLGIFCLKGQKLCYSNSSGPWNRQCMRLNWFDHHHRSITIILTQKSEHLLPHCQIQFPHFTSLKAFLKQGKLLLLRRFPR